MTLTIPDVGGQLPDVRGGKKIKNKIDTFHFFYMFYRKSSPFRTFWENKSPQFGNKK